MNIIKKTSLDGITLEMIVMQLVEHIGWKVMGAVALFHSRSQH